MSVRRLRSGGMHANSEEEYLNVYFLGISFRKLLNWKNNKRKKPFVKKMNILMVSL